MPIMAERPRITFEVSDRCRRALNIRASRLNTTVGQVIEWMAEQLMQRDLEIADESISSGDAPPQQKRGRKPKQAE